MTNPTGLPYTPAVAAGDWVVVSGQLGLRDGALVADFAGEVDQVIVNLADRLAEHGLGLEHVVKTTEALVYQACIHIMEKIIDILHSHLEIDES